METLNIKLKSRKTRYESGSSSDDEVFEVNLNKKDQAEQELESFVFGSESSILSNIDRLKKKSSSKSKKVKKDEDDDDEDQNKIDRPAEKQQQIGDYFKTRKPVWQDAADEEM